MAQEHDMIEPFVECQARGADNSQVISYGVSSYGYDMRYTVKFKVFTNTHSAMVDPKSFDEKSFVDINSDTCIIPSNSFVLTRTVEHFHIPCDVLTICPGKGTCARCDIIASVIPLEPKRGSHMTLEFPNTVNPPVRIYVNEDVAQTLFL